MKEYFIYSSANSNKFWGIEVKGSDLEVHYGRIGTVGTSLQKSFAYPYTAQAEQSKLIKSKLAKGYRRSPLLTGAYASVSLLTETVEEIICEL